MWGRGVLGGKEEVLEIDGFPPAQLSSRAANDVADGSVLKLGDDAGGGCGLEGGVY